MNLKGNVSIFFTLVLLFSGIVEHIICHGTHMTPTTQSHLLFLLMCDMGHLLAKACEKCLCEVVLSWVRWHRAHASPTCCCRQRRVEGSFAESSCWQAKGQDLSNNPARVPRVPSCCPRLTNATQRLIHCPLRNAPSPQMWLRKPRWRNWSWPEFAARRENLQWAFVRARNRFQDALCCFCLRPSFQK